MFKHLSPQQQFQKALSLWDEAMKAPFYRRRFPTTRPENAEAWQALPILKRLELFEHTYPRSKDMLTVPEEGFFISATSGTSGTARYVVCTHAEWEAFCAQQARALRLMGVTPRDLVANVFEAGYLWPSFLAVHDIVKQLNATHLPITSMIPPERILKYCREFKPTVMLSIPTMFVFLADLALKEGAPLEGLRLVAFAGEAMTEAQKAHIARGLGATQFRALAYSSADAGLMGYQCDHCQSGTYHVPTDFQLIEIIDPLTGKACGPGEKGDLIVTNFAQKSMPIVRYEIGDLGTWVAEPCPCGDPNPRFELLGRIGSDDFKLYATIIPMSVFERALEPFHEHVSLNFNLLVTPHESAVDLTLRVESADPEAAKAVIPAIVARIRELDVVINASLEAGNLHALTVQPVPLGTLERNPSTGKLIRLTDRRH
mgnify:CR=1 FL=1|uniref:Phenylacetate--CoA ligase family protein n=1 Tax=Desulfatirhabdium butyrativorans TaxID=340467 RepID=A0A7C4RUE2_9BACT